MPQYLTAEQEMLSNSHNSYGGGDVLMILLIVLGVTIGLFLLLRMVVLWYWKINIHIKQQEEIIRLLKKIANE